MKSSFLRDCLKSSVLRDCGWVHWNLFGGRLALVDLLGGAEVGAGLTGLWFVEDIGFGAETVG